MSMGASYSCLGTNSNLLKSFLMGSSSSRSTSGILSLRKLSNFSIGSIIGQFFFHWVLCRLYISYQQVRLI